jgi:hypothetical protein
MANQFLIPSGSTNGLGVKVAATATLGTTFHTAVAGTVDFDLVTIWAVNQNASGVPRTLTLEWGGATSPDNLITFSVPVRVGPMFITDRLPLRNGLAITAFADVANEVMLYGLITRIDN